jgi:plastocyanin
MPRIFRTANISRRSVHILFAAAAIGNPLVPRASAQTDAEVTVHLTIKSADGKSRIPSANTPLVVWLSPLGANGQTDLTVKPGTGKIFQMVQKDKMFQPHLLVVPTGSRVAFPNRDPFFHNVFSLFNGRRFDLGLYETGATQSVPFNREGVSYIFCNIHPDMGAVIISVATPYFAVASQASAQLHHVPPGMYILKVWAENATAASLEKASRRIQVAEDNTDAGAVDIVLQPRQPHTDKFGKPYAQHPEGSPY